MTKINKLAKTLARAKTRYYRELGRIARKAAKVRAKEKARLERRRRKLFPKQRKGLIWSPGHGAWIRRKSVIGKQLLKRKKSK